MTDYIADPNLKAAITANGHRIAVRDEAGRVIAYLLSPAELDKLDRPWFSSIAAAHGLDEAELMESHRRGLASKNWYTTEEVMKKLGLE